jgi:energy-converting hydrogenase Eha subunit C
MTQVYQEVKQKKAPLSPYFVLLVAIVLPGMGQVLNNSPLRGLIMLGFMLMLGVITYQVANVDVSVIGKFAGGIFIYSIMIFDAYYWAKYRSLVFKN